MADVIGEALFDIKAGTAGFLSDISGAVGKADGMFSNMGNNMSSKMQGVGGIMTAGLTAPILAIGAFALESAKTVDGAMNTMIRKTGETGISADHLKESFKNVFAKVPEDANTVSDAMSTVHTRLGLTGTALEGVTKQSIELARLMGTDVTSTTESVAKAFEAWHTPANEMNVDLDKMYRVATQTGVPISEMTGALSKVGAVASAAHVPMDTVTAAVGSLAAGGVPAKQGVSIVTEAITKMQEKGINAGTELPKMLQRIADGTATAADKTLLGQKNYDKLSGSLTDAKNGYTALTGAMDDSKGEIDKQADATLTFSEKLNIFKNDLMLAFEPLGKVLINVFSNVLKTVQPILPVITNIFGVFSHMPGPVQLIVVAIAGILAALGPILMILPALEAGFTILEGIIAGISMEAVIAFLPFILAAAVIAGIAVLLYLLYNNFKPFHDAVDEVLGWIQTLFGDLMSGDFGKFGDDFKNGILAGFNALFSFDWGGLLNTIVSALSGLGAAILNFILNIDWGALGNAIWTAIKSWLNPKFLKLLTDQLVTIGSFIFDKIKTGLAGLGGWFKNLLQDFGQWVWDGLITYFNFMSKLREQFISLLTNFGQWVWDGLITYFNFMTKLRTEFVNLLLGFGSWVWAGIGSLWDNLRGGFQGVVDFFGGLINGILNRATAATAAANQAVADAANPSGVQKDSSGRVVSVTDTGGNKTYAAASGAYVKSRSGGQLMIVGEGGEDEYIIPESKMGDFIGGLPHMAGGGIVGMAPSASQIATWVANAKITNTPYTDTPWEKPGEGWWWSTGTGSWQPPVSMAPSGGAASQQLSAFGTGTTGSTTASGGGYIFNITINNPSLTSMNDANMLGRKIAYTANEYLRRSGHSRG